MKPQNLITVYHGAIALENFDSDDAKIHKVLKVHEIRNLGNFCNAMIKQNCCFDTFDGFFVSYSIPQIGKEFDLLRFGTNYLLNIELKSELKVKDKRAKILKQMQKNYYYLKFCSEAIEIVTYVENDGFYHYNTTDDKLEEVDETFVADLLKKQNINYEIDPNKEFVPSNYLISPFNSTDKFINNEYFLTSSQQNIKEEIIEELNNNPFMFFCISANAGTGKTLLMYDIAKSFQETGKTPLVIHCGKLNDGHKNLNAYYNWHITSIRSISTTKENIKIEEFSIVFVDESQRISDAQLEALIARAKELKIPVVFSYDTKQFLRDGETKDMYDYLCKNHPDVLLSSKKLTNKIRTNKNIASFITNLMTIGKSKDNLNYESISIDYIDSIENLINYVNFLSQHGWYTIKYSTSRRQADPYDNLSRISNVTAHDVIGQEFSKVVLVMDENFKYDDDGKILVRNSYYSAKGMMYQIVTRVVDELKIIVLNNPELYLNLLNIKNMGDKP